MLLIEDVLVDEAILREGFVCNLNACKGACCVQGDAGAPLTDEEAETLETIYPAVKPFLRPEGIAAIEAQGKWVAEPGFGLSTPLVEGKECAYVTFQPDGTATCGIEQAWIAGAVSFQKPISCHLYPIREDQAGAFTRIRYDRWDICAAACLKGQQEQVPIFKFTRQALIRRFGEDFYAELADIATQLPEE
jgi:hypothetical protein